MKIFLASICVGLIASGESKGPVPTTTDQGVSMALNLPFTPDDSLAFRFDADEVDIDYEMQKDRYGTRKRYNHRKNQANNQVINLFNLTQEIWRLDKGRIYQRYPAHVESLQSQLIISSSEPVEWLMCSSTDDCRFPDVTSETLFIPTVVLAALCGCYMIIIGILSCINYNIMKKKMASENTHDVQRRAMEEGVQQNHTVDVSHELPLALHAVQFACTQEEEQYDTIEPIYENVNPSFSYQLVYK